MDCERFEAELLEVFDDGLVGEPRRARLEALLRHARGCPACAALEGLAEMLQLPPDRRDPIEDPDDAYWASFQQRLAERLRAEEVRRRRRTTVAWLGSLAALLSLAVAVWWLGPLGDGDTTAEIASTELPVQGGAEPPVTPFVDEAEPPIPEDLDEDLKRATPDTLIALEPLAGDGDTWSADPLGPFGDGEDGWLLPEELGLDDEGRRALLEWIQEQEARLRGGRA